MTLFNITSTASSLLSVYNLLSVYSCAGLGGLGTLLTLRNQCVSNALWLLVLGACSLVILV